MPETTKDLETLKKFSQKLRRCRVKAGLSQSELARRAGVSCQHMNHIEMGINWPSFEIYLALCRVLELGRVPLVG